MNGYEGTGRSLSLKLIQQLRQQGARLQSGEGKAGAGGGAAAAAGGDESGAGGMRTFREVILAEPIRWVLPRLSWDLGGVCLLAAVGPRLMTRRRAASWCRRYATYCG